LETVKTERAETPAPNSTFAIGGVSCSADSFVVAESLCSASTFVVKSPPIANLQNVTGHAKRRHNQRRTKGKTDRQNAHASQN
jgi:hypothetical protein